MSDEVKKAAEDVEESASYLPIVEGVKQIANHVERSEKRLNERIEGVERDTQRKIQDVDDKVEKGFDDVVNRLEKMRTAPSRALSIVDETPDFRDVLSKSAKENVSAFAQLIGSDRSGIFAKMDKASILRDPEAATAADRWFKLSTKMQMRHFDSEREANHAEFKALNDRFNAITKASLQEGIATEGGNLVPTPVASEVLRLIADNSLIFPRIRQYPMSKFVEKIPDESSAVTVNWVAEEGTLTPGEPLFTQKTLTANKIAGRATMSIEVVEDANIGLLPYLLTVFSEKIGGELDFQTMEGTTPFTGVNTASGVNAVAMTTATAGDDLTYAKIVDTMVAASEQDAIANGVWVCSPAIYGKIIGMVDSTGQPIVRFGMVEGSPAGTLIGRPIIVSARLGSFTVGSDATGNLYYGPLNKLIAGTRTGLRWDVTDAVNWTKYQMDARLVGRFAYVVGVAAAWSQLTKINND